MLDNEPTQRRVPQNLEQLPTRTVESGADLLDDRIEQPSLTLRMLEKAQLLAREIGLLVGRRNAGISDPLQTRRSIVDLDEPEPAHADRPQRRRQRAALHPLPGFARLKPLRTSPVPHAHTLGMHLYATIVHPRSNSCNPSPQPRDTAQAHEACGSRDPYAPEHHRCRMQADSC